MNRRASIWTILFACAVCATGAFSQANDEWIKFVAPDKTYSALMPVQPERQLVTKDTSAGQIVTEMFLAKYQGGVLLVAMTDYPADVDPSRELELDRDNFLKQVKATLTKEADVTVSGHPAREFWGSTATYDFVSILVMDGKRRVFQAAAGLPKTTDQSTGTRFLKSFEILKFSK